MSPLVTLTTDFGEGSPYVAQMKGVILTLNPQARVVDVSHAVPPQDVRCGALVLDDCCRRFPPETIHVAVVDPGVGTARALVMVRAGRHWFIAPDNGLLTLVARRQPPSLQLRLDQPAYWLDEVSATFHGRDIMAPVAAHLSRGVEPAQLGAPLAQLVTIPWPEPRVEARRVIGSVVAIDSFGNLLTNIRSVQLPALEEAPAIQLRCGNQQIEGLVHTYGQRAAGTAVALIGSGGRLELAVVNGHAGRQLGVQVDDEVVVQW